MTFNELTKRVKQSVTEIDPDAKVILFGSRARGDSSKSSDWDFLIVTSQKSDESLKRAIRDKLIDTELEAEEVISTLIYSRQTWKDYKLTPLYRNVVSEGIEL